MESEPFRKFKIDLPGESIEMDVIRISPTGPRSIENEAERKARAWVDFLDSLTYDEKVDLFKRTFGEHPYFDGVHPKWNDAARPYYEDNQWAPWSQPQSHSQVGEDLGDYRHLPGVQYTYLNAEHRIEAQNPEGCIMHIMYDPAPRNPKPLIGYEPSQQITNLTYDSSGKGLRIPPPGEILPDSEPT